MPRYEERVRSRSGEHIRLHKGTSNVQMCSMGSRRSRISKNHHGLCRNQRRGLNHECEKCHRLFWIKECHHKFCVCDGANSLHVRQVLLEVHAEAQHEEDEMWANVDAIIQEDAEPLQVLFPTSLALPKPCRVGLAGDRGGDSASERLWQMKTLHTELKEHVQKTNLLASARHFWS